MAYLSTAQRLAHMNPAVIQPYGLAEGNPQIWQKWFL
jgi:hypothetical protein